MTIQENIKETADLTNKYAKQELELAKLKASYQITSAATGVVKKTLIGILSVLAILFLSISGGFWLGSILENTAQGFLLVGSFYLILVLLIFFIRKHIENYVVKKITKKYF